MRTSVKLFLCVFCVVMLIGLCACSKDAQKAEVTPEPTATPVPTKEPDTFEFVLASPTPEPDRAVNHMQGFIISDADVDGVMMEDVNGWEGWTVVMQEYEGKFEYYAVPKEGAETIEEAVGYVSVSLNENCVQSMSCITFFDRDDLDAEAAKKFYEYLRNSFPFEVVANLDEEGWKLANQEIDMSYEHVLSEVQAGHDSRFVCGSFVFHIGTGMASFDFYAN